MTKYGVNTTILVKPWLASVIRTPTWNRTNVDIAALETPNSTLILKIELSKSSMQVIFLDTFSKYFSKNHYTFL